MTESQDGTVVVKIPQQYLLVKFSQQESGIGGGRWGSKPPPNHKHA